MASRGILLNPTKSFQSHGPCQGLAHTWPHTDVAQRARPGPCAPSSQLGDSWGPQPNPWRSVVSGSVLTAALGVLSPRSRAEALSPLTTLLLPYLGHGAGLPGGLHQR